MQLNILTLVAHAGVPINLAFMYRDSPVPYIRSMQMAADYEVNEDVSGHLLRLSYCFKSFFHFQTADNLPIYDGDGNQITPNSISEVPFGRPVEVFFTLHYTLIDGCYFLHAHLRRLQYCF